MKFLSQINVNTEYALPIVDGANGQVLTTDGNGAVYWGSVSVGALNLDGLSDVVITSPASGQILRYGIPAGSEDPNPVWHNWTPNFVTTANAVTITGTQTITGAKTFTAATTMSIASSSDVALTITKGGNGEGLIVNKTSGSGNAVTITGTLQATTIVKTGGTASQFLKADGSVDTNTYLTAHPAIANGGSVNNSNGTVVQDITVDANGHVTAIGSVDLDTRYYTESEITGIFGGEIPMAGYNLSNWDTAYADKINSASFNTTNGILTLTQQDGGTVTVDLDGRYLTSETDSQTLSWLAETKELTISNGNSVTLDGLATEGFVTGQGYITSYTETDTLDSVTDRGNTTTNNISVGELSATGGTIYLGTANTSSGHINAYENMTFNIDSDNDDTNRYFAWYTNGNAGGGSELMRLTEGGNVGIGTTSPSNKLTVEDTIGIKRAGVAAVSTIRQTGTGLIVNAPSGYHPLVIQHNSSELFRFTNGGNLGIGTTSPSSKLDIRDGNIELSDTAFSRIPEIRFTGFSGGGRYIYAGIKADEDGQFNGHLEFWTTPSSLGYVAANAAFAERMRITSTGNVLINTTGSPTVGGFTNTTLSVKQLQDGISGGGLHIEQASTDNVAFFGFTGSAFFIGTSYRVSGSYQPIAFTTNGSERLRITNAGNVGIGTTTPSTKLDVNGVITATGGNSTNWNTAYGWGNHASAGYLTSYQNNYISDVRLSESTLEFTGEGSAFTGNIDLSTLPFAPQGSYLTAEADTLATVTARGATTNGNIVINGNATIQNSGYLRIIAGSSEISGFTVFNSAQNGYLSNRITTGGHSRGWGWEFTSNEANNDAGSVYFRVGYNGAVSYLNSGNFGIGTTSPANTLQIGSVGATGYSGNRLAVGDGTNVVALHPGAVSYLTANGDIVVGAGGNTTNQVYVKSGGNVGIGTTSPDGKLDVTGDIWLNGDNVNANYYLRINKGNTSDGGILLYRNRTTLDWQVVNNTSTGDLGFYSYGAGSQVFYIKKSDGNVGIGTTSPSASSKLTISSTNLFGIDLTNSGTGGLSWQIGSTNNSYDAGGGKLIFTYGNASSNSLLTIVQSSGNVGIGTTSPQQKLTIEGGINNVWSFSTASGDQPGFVAGNNTTFSNSTNIFYNKLYGSGITASSFGVTLGNWAIAASAGSANNGLILGTFDAKPLIIGTSGSARVYVTAAGNVGIGTTTPSTKLDVNGVITATGGNSTNWNTAYGWGNHATAGYFKLDSVEPITIQAETVTFTGSVTIEGTLTESSSIRFKENIEPLQPSLEAVNALNPVSYNKIGEDNREIGLIAEDVAELFPEVVTYNEEGQPQGIQYQRLSVILLKAVQELTERVNKLENK